MEGEIKFLDSWRHASQSKLIREIIDEGKPVVVASDKGKTPSTVEKIASSLGAEVFEPEEDVDSDKKDELGKGENSHEKDASASALNAYNHLNRERRKIRKIAQEKDVSIDLAAQNYFLDKQIETGSTEQVEDPGTSKEETEKIDGKDPEKERLEKKIENLEEQNKDLREKVSELEDKKQGLQDKLDDLREENRYEAVKDQEISKRDAVISEKQDRINSLEKELENSNLREKQYRRAVKHIFHDNYIELIPKDGDETVFKSDRYKIEDLKGVELDKYFLLLQKPEPDMERVLNEFKEDQG